MKALHTLLIIAVSFAGLPAFANRVQICEYSSDKASDVKVILEIEKAWKSSHQKDYEVGFVDSGYVDLLFLERGDFEKWKALPRAVVEYQGRGRAVLVRSSGDAAFDKEALAAVAAGASKNRMVSRFKTVFVFPDELNVSGVVLKR